MKPLVDKSLAEPAQEKPAGPKTAKRASARAKPKKGLARLFAEPEVDPEDPEGSDADFGAGQPAAVFKVQAPDGLNWHSQSSFDHAIVLECLWGRRGMWVQ